MGLGDLSPGAQIGIGVTVGIISTSIQSLGLTLQRKSHLLEDGRPAHIAKRPPHRRRRWQIGMLLFLVSNILGSSIQITTLPLVILSPLQASGLVFNSICATLILAEPFTRLSLVGTILVCGGAALIAAFGALKESAHSLDELLELLGKPGFLVWMFGTLLLVAAILIGVKMVTALSPRTKHIPRVRMGRGIAYGCVSGILSAHCLLVAKSAVELLVRTIVDRVNQFNRWQSWVILLGLVVLALTQLYYLHRGLKLCSTSVLYPLVFCVYNIIAILDGLIYYRQASRLSPLHGGLIALGTIILLSGVLALSWQLHDESNAPASTGSALTPGIGYVDTDSEDSEDNFEHRDDESIPSTPIRNRMEANRILSATLQQRRKLSQAEEIWGQLQDDDDPTPLTSGYADEIIEEDEVADESTGLLRKHPARRKTQKRSSYGFPPNSGGPSSPQQRHSSTRAQQGPTGGWWKMKWWREPHERRDQDDLP